MERLSLFIILDKFLMSSSRSEYCILLLTMPLEDRRKSHLGFDIQDVERN